MLLYSHIWDGLLKLVTLAGLVLLAIWLDLNDRLHSVAMMIVVVTVVWIFLYRQFLSIVATWLYARISLRTPVTFAEAKALRKLFQLDVAGQWIPIKEVKALPLDARRAALLQMLDDPKLSRKALLL